MLPVLQSVIECLNYMATGDMPPGSKGNLFVHDPKVRMFKNNVLMMIGTRSRLHKNSESFKLVIYGQKPMYVVLTVCLSHDL